MQDFNALPLDTLFEALTKDDALGPLMRMVRQEDLSNIGDITSICSIEPTAQSTAMLRTRQDIVVAGLPLIPKLISLYEADIDCTLQTRDGMNVQSKQPLAELTGSLRDILAIERPMLNFIGRLSGIATLTQQYVRKIMDTNAVVCDTRKTTPGWRTLEKYAVRCGGGTLHRMGLYDAVLLKDNHLAAIPSDNLTESINRAATKARAEFDLRFVEVEVDTIDQFEQVLRCTEGLVDIVLLDNMSPQVLAEAVELRNDHCPRLQLEASGGITLDSIEAVAKAGVDRISVGALTHGVKSIDVGLDIEA